MDLSKAVASLALILGAALAAGHARSADNLALKDTVQDRLVVREAMRRAELAEHYKRKEDFTRLCNKPLNSPAELEACRVAYRKL